MDKPLAYRMRPDSLEEFFGQEHIVGENKLLYRLIKADRLTSAILWGPPGCGKTSLARVISKATKHRYIEINATSSGVADIKKIAEECGSLFLNPTGKTIVFIDEIHRFNKLQQDSLLPLVEKGQIILVGATTENPYFEVNKALVSRSTIFKLEPLKEENIEDIVKAAIIDKEKGLGKYAINIDEKTIKYIAKKSCGDVRTALSSLELAAITSKMEKDGSITITEDIIDDCMQKKKISYDKAGEDHYDNISAFIKSMRGSDPDATLIYLAKILEAGEDPMFVARRIVIQSAEDVGIANPMALVVATSAMQAVHLVGMPEAKLILADAAVYVAISPKSNTVYMGINKAIEDVQTIDTGTAPMHIRNAPIADMKDHGYGTGYKYPHDYENAKVAQQYLPDAIKNNKYFNIKEWEKDYINFGKKEK